MSKLGDDIRIVLLERGELSGSTLWRLVNAERKRYTPRWLRWLYDVSLGGVYVECERLERRGLIASRWGEATGGARPKYFRAVTP